MKKIRYLCFEYSNVSDGGAIYDKNFVRALKQLDFDVDVIEFKRQRKFSAPFWLSRVKKDFYSSEVLVDSEDVYTIVSHEALADVLDVTDCDLYIIHNVFCTFDFLDNPFVNWFYRFNSLRIYKKILNNCNASVCLSFREYKFLRELGERICTQKNIFCEPPGVHFCERFDNFDNSILRLSGTNSWLPKRLSQLSQLELDKLKSCYSICHDDLSFAPSFSLINEKFLSGFKLKLIQMLYRGDVIASFVDLEEEISMLEPKNYKFKHVKSVDEAIEFFKKNDVSIISNNSNKTFFENKYSWLSIVKRLLSKTKLVH